MVPLCVSESFWAKFCVWEMGSKYEKNWAIFFIFTFWLFWVILRQLDPRKLERFSHIRHSKTYDYGPFSIIMKRRFNYSSWISNRRVYLGSGEGVTNLYGQHLFWFGDVRVLPKFRRAGWFVRWILAKSSYTPGNKLWMVPNSNYLWNVF